MAGTDALRELPKCLDQMVSDVRAARAKKTSWFGRIKKALRLTHAADEGEDVRQLEALAETVKTLSVKIANQRG